MKNKVIFSFAAAFAVFAFSPRASAAPKVRCQMQYAYDSAADTNFGNCTCIATTDVQAEVATADAQKALKARFTSEFCDKYRPHKGRELWVLRSTTDGKPGTITPQPDHPEYKLHAIRSSFLYKCDECVLPEVRKIDSSVPSTVAAMQKPEPPVQKERLEICKKIKPEHKNMFNKKKWRAYNTCLKVK